jgi:uncharacterized transporter YbjL
MAGSAVVLVVVGAGTILLGRLLDLTGGFQGGAFAGVGTSTPTLAAATAAAGGGTEPAVGYALTYPLGWSWGSSPSTWRWAAGGRRPGTPSRRPSRA